MSNSSVPFGFKPFGRLDGGAPTWELEQVTINSSNAHLMFTGDLVRHSSDGNNCIDILETGSTSAVVPLGVFWGCEYYSAAAQRKVWSRYYPGSVGSNAANGTTRAWVISDPNVLFTAVGGTSAAGATFATADVGFNINALTSQSSYGNTANGQSAMLLSTATLSANASAWWKIIDLYSNKAPSGIPGTESTAYNQVVLKPNAWERAQGTYGIST